VSACNEYRHKTSNTKIFFSHRFFLASHGIFSVCCARLLWTTSTRATVCGNAWCGFATKRAFMLLVALRSNEREKMLICGDVRVIRKVSSSTSIFSRLYGQNVSTWCQICSHFYELPKLPSPNPYRLFSCIWTQQSG
jgi:hypothetical protein